MLRKKLGDLVVEQGQVTQQQVETALAYQRATGKPLGEVLLLLGIATEEQLLDALAQQQSVMPWDLRENPPTPEALNQISAELCLKHVLVPVKLEADKLVVAMRNPGDLEVVDALYAITRKRIEPVQAIDVQLAATLKNLFGGDPSLRNSFEKFVTQALADLEEHQDVNKVLHEIAEEETRPVIGMVNQIISEAVKMGASDIHIEPRESCAELRLRVDGRLLKIKEIPHSLVRMVVARIKIMSELDIANHRHPQDGRIEIREDGRSLDLRVSVLPTHYGSRVVIRVLDRAVALKTLDQLGFNEENAEIFGQMISKPYGMVLVTGPTGSGKTTTLYSALNQVWDEGVNIMTCEDPIEYELLGVNQSQVNERAGLTFAAQLRAILRQDPDVVLVGEIRDRETAETAIRAAMTGHLVFSTLHANDAPSAIPRLVDMGVEPYLLSTSLAGVVSQRLLRKLCPDCANFSGPTGAEVEFFQSLGFVAPEKLGHAAGCAECNYTGYRGRVAVHEVLPVTESVAELIAVRGTTDALRHAAAPYGFQPLFEDAIERVLAGQTSLEEARRVIVFDTYKKVERRRHLRLAS